jgi:hypothetical protein
MKAKSSPAIVASTWATADGLGTTLRATKMPAGNSRVRQRLRKAGTMQGAALPKQPGTYVRATSMANLNMFGSLMTGG